jgi:exopolysaccharide biosynthesis polyprenyl glycosylphosphotransferase
MTHLDSAQIRAADADVPPPGADDAPSLVGAAHKWQRDYARSLVFVDAAMLAFAGLVAVTVRFGSGVASVGTLSYYGVTALLVVLWCAALGLSRCYEVRFLGQGTEEYKRVANASMRLAGTAAILSYSFKLELARGFVGVAVPLGAVSLIAGRGAARAFVYRGRRERGAFCHRVLVVGTHPHIRALVQRLVSEPNAGFTIVGACVPGARESRLPGGSVYDVPVVGHLADIPQAIRRIGADTVAVTASPGINGDALRQLSYELEGSGVDLLVAPALTNVTGTRISIRPVAGLPLLHVDEPELSGARKVIKGAFDRIVAGVSLLVLAPLLIAIALVVRTTSSGPALFRQERVGRGGQPFQVWKFRSMYVGAEARLAELAAMNEYDGPLFKMREDPRITRVGRFLRKYSLDELPQLVNVLRGQMSLVGPRPPLEKEVQQYAGHAHRRLMVKPGITGLWQVSGRSDLSWDETVRLDLTYVENWSLALDITVLFRTILTVVRGSGAY